MSSQRRVKQPLWVGLWIALALHLLSACAATAPPPAPRAVTMPERTALRSFPSDGEVQLSWVTVPGAVTYTLYWSDQPDVAATRSNPISGLKGTSYLHGGLRNGGPVYYRLVALDASGRELYAFPPVGDIPYPYELRRFDTLISVVARPRDTFESLAERHLGDPGKGWLIRDFNSLAAPVPFQAVLIPLKPYERGGLLVRGYRTVPVLVYHQLSRTKPSRMTVMESAFEAQMAYLKRNGYVVITLDELADFLEFKGQVPEKAVVITFDDGWASTYSIALPVLRKYDFKATLFVTTDLIGSTKKALTWPQVKALEDSGVIDIQCHTRSHPNLADAQDLDLKAYLGFLEEELIKSREIIHQRVGKQCRYLAYPYGGLNHLVVAMAQRAGYRTGFTVDRGANPFFVTNYRVLRSMIFGEYNLKQFAENLENFGDRVIK